MYAASPGGIAASVSACSEVAFRTVLAILRGHSKRATSARYGNLWHGAKRARKSAKSAPYSTRQRECGGCSRRYSCAAYAKKRLSTRRQTTGKVPSKTAPSVANE